jgi:hypothetical protein
MMLKTVTYSESDIRNMLGAYLTKPITIDSGVLSTQQDLSATSLSTGGLSGSFIIKNQGNISLYDNNNRLSIFIGFA